MSQRLRWPQDGLALPSFIAVLGGVLGRWPLERDLPAWGAAVADYAALFSPEEADAVVAAWRMGATTGIATISAQTVVLDLRGKLCPFRFARIRSDSPRETAVIVSPDSTSVWTFRRFPRDFRLVPPEVARRCLVESLREDRYEPVFEMRIDL